MCVEPGIGKYTALPQGGDEARTNVDILVQRSGKIVHLSHFRVRHSSSDENKDTLFAAFSCGSRTRWSVP